jgi:hypothetical protein
MLKLSLFSAHAFWWVCGLAASHCASASDFTNLSVLALGPVDGRAVVRSQSGAMRVLSLGDSIDGTQAKLVQVLVDRLVLEDTIKSKEGDTILEVVWMYKAGTDGRSRVQRLGRIGPAETAASVPRLGGSAVLIPTK